MACWAVAEPFSLLEPDVVGCHRPYLAVEVDFTPKDR